MKRVTCNICPHYCKLLEDQMGICNARKNINGEIKSINYGKLTSIALDSIEKKPLYKFYPKSKILSVGSFGCNFNCYYCQNHEISMTRENLIKTKYVEAEELIQMALDLKERGNIGIAYTYNEPLIGYEYVKDCSRLAKENNLKNVVITNGYFNEEPMKELLPYIDALNIDLKAYTQEFYKKIGGDLDSVKNFIKLASNYSHIEITTLVIPDENDSEEEIRAISKFIASINPDIPFHISRFFPRNKAENKYPTKVRDIYRLADIARERLTYVYEGNC